MLIYRLHVDNNEFFILLADILFTIMSCSILTGLSASCLEMQSRQESVDER